MSIKCYILWHTAATHTDSKKWNVPHLTSLCAPSNWHTCWTCLPRSSCVVTIIDVDIWHWFQFRVAIIQLCGPKKKTKKINKRGQQFQKILTQISDRVQLALISTLNSGHLKFVVHNKMENIYGQIWWGEFRYKEMEYNSIKLPAIKFKIFVYLYRQF